MEECGRWRARERACCGCLQTGEDGEGRVSVLVREREDEIEGELCKVTVKIEVREGKRQNKLG